MSSSLSHMSKTERRALERFGDAVKSRLGEYVVRMSVFGSKGKKKGTDLFFHFSRSSWPAQFHPSCDFLFDFVHKSGAVSQLSPLERFEIRGYP